MNNGGTMNKEYTLKHGSHRTREEGMCLMEAVAWLAGEDHSDRPACACPALAAYGRALNDVMGNDEDGDALRAKYLADLAPRLVGTKATPEVEKQRALVLSDYAVRMFVPMALDVAGLGEAAARLRKLEPVTDERTARAAARAADDAWFAADAAAAVDAAHAARDAWAAARGAATYGAWAASRAAWATVRAAADAAAKAPNSPARSAGSEVWKAARAAFVAALEVTG